MQPQVKSVPQLFGTSTQWCWVPSCVTQLAQTRLPVQSLQAFTALHSFAGTQPPCQQLPAALISGISPGLQVGVSDLHVTFDGSQLKPATQRPAWQDAVGVTPSSPHLS